jgi:hypothetical protein
MTNFYEDGNESLCPGMAENYFIGFLRGSVLLSTVDSKNTGDTKGHSFSFYLMFLPCFILKRCKVFS